MLFNKPVLLSPIRRCSVPVDLHPAVVYPLIRLRVPDPGQHVRKSHLYLICCLTAIRGGDHSLWRNAQHWLYFDHLNHFTGSHATKSSENKFAGKIRSFLNHVSLIYAIYFPYFCQRNREIISSCCLQVLSKWCWEFAQGFIPQASFYSYRWPWSRLLHTHPDLFSDYFRKGAGSAMITGWVLLAP